MRDEEEEEGGWVRTGEKRGGWEEHGRTFTGPSIHGGFCVMVTAVHTSTSPTTTMAPKNCEEIRIG